MLGERLKPITLEWLYFGLKLFGAIYLGKILGVPLAVHMVRMISERLVSPAKKVLSFYS